MDDEQQTDADLLMNCMLLAFQYYPLVQQPPSPNRTAVVAQRLLNGSADAGATTDLFAAYATTAHTVNATAYTTVHPSFAAASNARDFIADCTRASPQRPFDLPWELKVLWALLFAGMLLVAILGNCIVIWIVLGEHNLLLSLEFCFV